MPWLVGTAAAAFGDRGREARRAEELDHPAGDPRLLAVACSAPSWSARACSPRSTPSPIDPARGVFILALLIVYIGGSLLLFAWRAPPLQGGGLFAPISREGALLLNNLLLATAAATVLLGTLYPLVLDPSAAPSRSGRPSSTPPSCR